MTGDLRRLREEVRDSWIAHERDWTRPGFRAVVVHRIGNLREASPSRWGRALADAVYWPLFRLVRNRYGIELPYTVKLGRGVVIDHQGAIVIHGHAEIGDGSLIRHGVTIGNRHLERPRDAPRLGARVNVGAGAQILGDVTVGDDARIGANAVVLDDVPAGATAVGVPATIRRTR
jgi:serine O-acetyltransferase